MVIDRVRIQIQTQEKQMDPDTTMKKKKILNRKEPQIRLIKNP